MLDMPILSLLLWLPILGGFTLLLLRDEQQARVAALAISLLTFTASVWVWWVFDVSSPQLQFIERYDWIVIKDLFTIQYYLAVDGISLALLLLNVFITPFVVLASWGSVKTGVAQYLAIFLLMEGIVNGVFMAQDAMLFFIFFEAMLIPLFLVIGIWGGENRVYATIKFFLYTFLGSVFFLISLIYLEQKTGTFEIAKLHQLLVSPDKQTFIFFAFLLAFGVKIPMWPVHTWLPDAHVEAPTGGSVILAAITLKVAGYAFLRLMLPVVPDALLSLALIPVILSVTAILYIGLVALVQEDMKKLIAYSSISHMGFVTLAIFVAYLMYEREFNPILLSSLLQGSIVQMVSHGFISAALFLSIGVLYDRMHTREIAAYGGVANRMPWFAAFFVLFAMANSGLPGTSGFVGEFMIIANIASYASWLALLVALTLVIGAAYSLWLVKKVFYGEVANADVDGLQDINKRESILLGGLAIAILWLGLYPKPLLELIEPPVKQITSDITLKINFRSRNKCTPDQEEPCPVWDPWDPSKGNSKVEGQM